MYIKRIKINNFRGIKELNEEFDNRLICLIGNSDSTKSTILDAIEYCLYPYWNIPLTDIDFYNCNIENNIVIQLTVGDIPSKLLTEDKYGLYIRKDVDEDKNDEPLDDDEKFLTVELRVNEMFECKWSVINNRTNGKQISHKDRAEFNVSRIGEKIDRDFNIGRNSVIKQYVKETSLIDKFIIDTIRSIKSKNLSDEELNFALTTIKKVLKDNSVNLDNELKISFELKNSDIGFSSLNLCDGKIPIRYKGIGTKRLISSVLNINKLENSACILIDEIEYGLEPHKLSDLLYKLHSKSSTGQVILTTHLPITISELSYSNLFLCISKTGITKCNKFDEDLQPLLRANPYAFISNKIIVVEGATESGILKTLNYKWSDSGNSLSLYNSVVMDGKGGINACQNAQKLKNIGYDVCLFIDADDLKTNQEAEKLRKKGIKVLMWKEGNSTEKQLISDLTFDSLSQVIDMMIELKDRDKVLSYFKEFEMNTIDLDELKINFNEDEIKEKIVNILTFKNSKGKPRFKNFNYGILLGKIIDKNYDKFLSDSIPKIINELKKWYRGEQNENNE